MALRVENLTFLGLNRTDLLELYRLMLLSRRLDDEEIKLKKQNLIYFQISGAGHEAILVAAGKALRTGSDWFYPYYRDRALMLTLGMTPLEMLLEAVGAAADPNSGGRQMPCHWGLKRANVVSQSSPTGTQFLQAVGCSEGGRLLGLMRELKERPPFREDEVVYVSAGDGTTSEGEFWEAINTAATDALPVLFLITDNQYAISVPVEAQTPGGDIGRCMGSVPGLRVMRVDGTDPLASYQAMVEAAQHLRAGKGPVLLHAMVIRPYGHSMSDDEQSYKPAREREEEAKRDPITTYPKYLIREGLATQEAIERIQKDVEAEIAEAEAEALKAPKPKAETIYDHLYSPTVDPTSGAFETEPRFEGQPETMVTLINRCLKDEMTRDPRIVLFGEDVADATREQNLESVAGKGGVFKVTYGLQKQFGKERVFNSPLAEANIVGRAIGMATRGIKPVAEIQLTTSGRRTCRSETELPPRWRSNAFLPGRPGRDRGYLRGSIAAASGRVSSPTWLPDRISPTAVDTNRLLRVDPLRRSVCSWSTTHLRQPYAKGPYPGHFADPFGKARVAREGTTVSVIT